MFTKETVAPLTINTTTNTNGKATMFSAAAFKYVEEPASRTPSAAPQRRTSPRANGMNGIPGSSPASSGMYVRALYDYEADDRTSLSFRQGDLIQVITQLRSGWWDGIIDGVRGWFPSNYCAVVTGPEDASNREQKTVNGELSGESATEDEYEEYEEELDANGYPKDDNSRLPIEGAESREHEEAAFWIPQATQNGRLFYYNTLTGVSKMELPLETPTSVDETGPRDRMNIHVPDQTRPPPEMMARGFERDEEEYDDGNSTSEGNGESLMLASRGSLPRRRQSYISDEMSPSTSMESLSASPVIRNRSEPQDSLNPNLSMNAAQQGTVPTPATGTTSFTTNAFGPVSAAAIPRSFFDEENTTPLTWSQLVENMRRSVESYRQVINNADRSEYIRKAEDVSDHLRMLLAAGSGTTDNHSGNPSIISTNKALYPHFRDMMSRFSKLVLSSHMAATDWPAPDSYTKCLQEAEGVLHGVYGYVEVARSQRGQEIPRLVPGFLLGSNAGGSWQNNNLGARDASLSASFIEDEYEPYAEASTRLDVHLLERMEDLKKMMISSIRRLDEHLTITEKIITPSRHEQVGNSVCIAGGRVVEFYRPWMSTIESVNLAPLELASHDPQLVEFYTQKQRLYDLVMNLLMACQAVAAPLGDEWAELRGEPLEDRLNEVRKIARQLEYCASQFGDTVQLLHDVILQEDSAQPLRNVQNKAAHRRTDGGASYERDNLVSLSQPPRPQLADVGHTQSFSEGVDPVIGKNRKENSKVKKFFGEVPLDMMPKRDSEETPSFLKLDFEGEISYDTKVNPGQLRGGTLTALVEQLTRHDKLDSHFNNTFLLTYKSFTSASELFELLVKRFSIQPPRGISEDDYRTWSDKKQKPIRIRVVNILKSWFEQYWMENNDQASDDLLRRVLSFAKSSVETTSTPGSGPLMAVIDQRLRGQDTNGKRLVPTQSTLTPTPIIPKNMKKLKFLDIDTTEFARQLTIIESRLYGKIKPTECLNKTWQKKVSPTEADPATNVKALILHSNQLTNWVAEMILTQSDVKRRVVVIKHFVSVADVSASVAATLSQLLKTTEMPCIEQLFDIDLNHFSPRHSSHTPAEPNLGPSQRSDTQRARKYAKTDGQYQELW